MSEEDRAWEALDSAPKWQWEGQWKHSSRPTYRYREGVLKPWLDYWLKGTGAPPADLNRVSYQISPVPWKAPDDPPVHGPTEGWPTSTAWPPADATEVALRLTPAGLRAKPSPESRTFHARPDEAERQASIEARDPDIRPVGYAPPCPGTADGDTRLVYESLPVAEETVIAGNPSARLALRSSLPAGTFSVQLFDLAPDFGCPAGVPTGYEFLTEGGADLRFLADRYTPQQFPAGEHEVRVQLQSLAEQLDPGHRLAVVLSLGPQKARLAQGHFPHLTIGGSSRILLPVTRGSLPPG
jgi:predicted acyl esterase